MEVTDTSSNQSELHQSPGSDSAKREFSNVCVETFRHLGTKEFENGIPETPAACESPRNPALSRRIRAEMVEATLVGWRRSADGTLLCPFSLLTGNFTGNFAKSRLLARQRL
jgi:hypothetical protein